ncbi:zf-HC2 domain-containing protein [Dactylosporangium sp. NBC_01737]|uniref:anti-sigma factor family protein n=1 Tax=Dactylosporangium sp. NBC_01737 TaxID=2975959 RepID=UPI002E106ACE|nr:zf-HC2 domain-containing protein [Dactylosporangium sp. NBC_01737]
MGPEYSTEPGSSHVLDRLAGYFSGALPVEDEQAVEAHLLHCADCRAEYDDLGSAALLVASLPVGVLDELDRADDEPDG